MPAVAFAKLSFVLLYSWLTPADRVPTVSYTHLDVYKRQTRYVVGISLTPYVLRLRLYTTFCTEHADSAVQYTKRKLYLLSLIHI